MIIKNKLRKKLSLKIIFFVSAFIAIIILVFMNVSVANPESSIFFNLKRLYEKTQLIVKVRPTDKLHYQYKLLDNRLAELSFIIDNKISSCVLSTSLRYSTTLGQITDLIIYNNMTYEVPIVTEKFDKQLIMIKNLINKYPKDDSEFKYLVDDKNYLEIYINKFSSF
jgi:hypothetical protein